MSHTSACRRVEGNGGSCRSEVSITTFRTIFVTRSKNGFDFFCGAGSRANECFLAKMGFSDADMMGRGAKTGSGRMSSESQVQ